MIADKICDAIQQRVQRIEVVNGYKHNVGIVSRGNRTGEFPKRHLDIVVSYEDPVVNKDLSCPGNPPRIAYDVMVHATGLIRQEPTDLTPIDTLLDQFWSDIARAITSPTNWWLMNGNCINATLEAPRRTNGDDDGTAGVTAIVNCTYRVFETRPDLVAN